MTLAGSLTTAGTYNANGGINNIPVDPVTETDAARKHEVRVLNEISNGAARNYFNFSLRLRLVNCSRRFPGWLPIGLNRQRKMAGWILISDARLLGRKAIVGGLIPL